MTFEATTKNIEYVLADPDNQTHIEHASLQEREGFSTGIDPVELPELIRFIADKGHVWLQYAIEGSDFIPTGVIEFIPLEKALEFDPNEVRTQDDISNSAFNTVMANQERVFRDARKFGDDGDITYHHGIAMSRRQKGYGTLFLNHALNCTPNFDNSSNIRDTITVCYIDAAQYDEDTRELKPAANESSYTIHMKAGFVLTGVVEAPVYNDRITYYSILRPRDSSPISFADQTVRLGFNEPDVVNVIEQVRDLTSRGYLGVAYDRMSHQMTFKKAR